MATLRLPWPTCLERAARVPEPDVAALRAVLASAPSAPAPPPHAAAQLTQWRVPRALPDGSCSARPGDLSDFDALRRVYGASAPAAGAAEVRALRRLAALDALVRELQRRTSADWLGVYRVVPSPPAAQPADAGERCLVKEAYAGAPSRPFFPLTAAFAAHSSNATVARRAEAALIADTRALGGEEPYYVCDGKVRAELCAPIVGGADGATVIGIIDAEAFAPGHFSAGVEGAARADLVLLACRLLAECDLLRGMLEEEQEEEQEKEQEGAPAAALAATA